MEVKIIKNLGRDFYKYAQSNDTENVKKTYKLFLKSAKESPSIAKLVFNNELKNSRDLLFLQAREQAKIGGSTSPILDAVKKNSQVNDLLTNLHKDNDIKSLQSSLEKSLKSMYRKTRKIRNHAKLTRFDSISLDELRNKRSYSWISRFF